ncbi:MAG: LysR substrate-binding domain-containing protein [Edaphocola sp.]
MTITQLEYVVSVATYKSFVAAAEKSFVTQPTLSMQIHKLEEELNVRLFDRNKHPIATTEVGEEIVQQAKIVLAEAGKIQEIIQHRQGTVAGVFRIGVIPTLAPYILPQLLENHAKAHPGLKLAVTELQTQDILRKLKDDELDCGLLSTPLEDNHIKEYPLFYESLIAYFGKGEPALTKRTIAPADIDMKRIWMLNEGNCLRNQIINLCSEHIEKLQEGRPYKYESGNVETLRKMVDKNGGVTILPELATFDFNEDQAERLRYFDAEEPVREISLATNDHFVRLSVLQTLMDEILKLVPEKMRVQKKNRKILRIQTARL